MAGGGGSSGSVVYPDHMLAVHHYLLTGGMYPNGASKWSTSLTGSTQTENYVDTDYGLVHKIRTVNNPYTTADAYDPYPHIESLNNIATEYEASIDSFQDDDDSEEVANYAFDLKENVNQQLNQVAGRFYEINAVAGTQFDTFNSIIMARYLKDVDDFRQNIRKSRKTQKLEHERALALIKFEIEKVKVSLKVEEHNTGIDFNYKDATWDLEIYREAGNILGSIAGSAIPSSKERNRVGSSIAGGIGGLAAGAALFGEGGALAGSALGGPGGIAIAGILGGIGGLLG